MRGAVTETYIHELALVDVAFAAARATQGASIPCRRGCSACCVAVFDVHPADALLLGSWFDEQSERTRAEVLLRAHAVTAEVASCAGLLAASGSADFEGWVPRDGFATLGAAAITQLAGETTLPCPLVDPEDGACLAHESRPALCRLQGLPWRDEATSIRLEDFCRIDPRQADLEEQPLDLGRLHAARAEASLGARQASRNQGLPTGRTFIAEALLRWVAASDASPP